jgi:hypothetical protein
MQKQITALCLTAVLLLGLAACGDSTDSTSTSVSAEAVSSAEADETSSAEDSVLEESSLEDSTLEDAELTIDEEFALFISDAEGICLKLRVCDRKGSPIRNGTVSLTEAAGNTGDTSQLELADTEICTAETDSSGYAFVSQLELDTEYTLTVYDQEDAPVGTVALQVVSGDSYTGSSDEDGIVLTVKDGSLSNVDMAIIATDDDGSVSSFSLFRMTMWKDDTE